MNNGRDCPHGRQVGKCDTCDLIEVERDLEQTKQILADRTAELEQVKRVANELAAQVEHLRHRAMDLLKADDLECEEDRATIHANMNDAVLSTPAQCLAEVRAQAVEYAVDLYTHKWLEDEELNKISVDILKKGTGYIYPEGLLEYAKQIRQNAMEEL